MASDLLGQFHVTVFDEPERLMSNGFGSVMPKGQGANAGAVLGKTDTVFSDPRFRVTDRLSDRGGDAGDGR
jgi:hypothetical protein